MYSYAIRGIRVNLHAKLACKPCIMKGCKTGSAKSVRINSHLKEKCGVIAVYSASNYASYFARRGLSALQHRGQESAGISILNDRKKIITHKGMGLIPLVMTETVLKKLGHSPVAIAHNRYATSGSGGAQNAQPMEVKNGKYHMAIGHNGNIPDVSNIRKKLGIKKSITSDTFLAASLIIQERLKYNTWEETFAHVLPEFRGAYNFVILTNDGSLFAIRDPYGIRPLCLGKLSDGWVVASESVALDAVKADYVRDVKPGEIIKITYDGKINSYFFDEPKQSKYCLFEYIYFARPDSYLNETRIRAGREISGKLLGQRLQQKHIQPDVVIPTFDSGYPAAKGVASALQLPIVDAITTSHYVGRTFIQPGQENRTLAVSNKHNIIPDEIIGKKVVVVDDSAVRLTTSRSLMHGLKDAGAQEVYLAIASPPVVNQCDLGIDMRSKKDLPAAKFGKLPLEKIEKNIAELIDADAVVYLPIEETTKAMGGTQKNFYYTPFGGPHPIRDKQEVFPKRVGKTTGKQKICVFLSGAGTNLQKIIDQIEDGEIDAEITEVISNKSDAFGLIRAKRHNIATCTLPYTKKLTDKEARRAYEKQLIKEIQRITPDLILLSGWTFVLSDTFLKAVQHMGITVINHHPALLSSNFSDQVVTSRGMIPVIRGPHGCKDAFENNLPVSGITVHQVLPGDNFDVGPIIMKSEVRRKKHDTIDSFEKRLRSAEYLLLPTAIKRVIHVMNHYNIDISKGEFPW